MEIKKIGGDVIYRTDKHNIKDAVKEAVNRGANLGGADLRGADLYGADLCGAILKGADLHGADLCGADLYGTNLYGANLYNANLGGANLYGAYLRDANLHGANLRGANLIGADLHGAELRCADLYGANLCGANLRGAELIGANLGSANLYCADLYGATDIPFVPLACPSDGEFVGWKKVNGKLIELRVPEDAKKSSATTDKCRCDKALVVSISDIETGEEYAEVTNYNYKAATYRVGEMVYPDSFDENRWHECSNGIHFFINKQSAINY